MCKASFCSLVVSFISFKEWSLVFRILTKFRAGVLYNLQMFRVKKIDENILYNHGIIRAGESPGSPDSRYKATLATNASFSVGIRCGRTRPKKVRLHKPLRNCCPGGRQSRCLGCGSQGGLGVGLTAGSVFFWSL